MKAPSRVHLSVVLHILLYSAFGEDSVLAMGANCVSLMLLQNDVDYFVGVGYGLDSSRPYGRGEFTDPIGREVS